jgi:hypothetical protein
MLVWIIFYTFLAGEFALAPTMLPTKQLSLIFFYLNHPHLLIIITTVPVVD